MSIVSAKTTCLNNLQSYFETAHKQYILAEKLNSLSAIESVLFHARKALESICDYVILDKFPAPGFSHDGETVLKGTVNGHKSPSKVINTQKQKIVLASRISIIHDWNFFSTDIGENDNYKFRCHIVRYGGNKGAHNEIEENKNPTFNECRESYVTLIGVLEWFYRNIIAATPLFPQWFLDSQSQIPANVFELINNSLPKNDEWYAFKEKFGGFEDISAKYILITSSYFREKLSDYDLNAFVGSAVNWSLVIDFDSESQQKGLWRIFDRVIGQEKIRTYTKGDKITEADVIYYFLAQGINPSQSENNPIKWEKDKNGYGKTLENILDETKSRNQIYIIIINNNASFVEAALNTIYTSYQTSLDKIHIGVIVERELEKNQLDEKIQEIGLLFGNLTYHLFDFTKFIHHGFALHKRQITELSDSTLLVPAYTKRDRKHTFVALPWSIHDDLKSKYIELLHQNIGKEQTENGGDDRNFYLGDEITWRDLFYLGKGKDIERNKVLQVIIPEIIDLLQNKPKGFWVYKLNHEASAGGTTSAKRIAYQVGAKVMYNNFPTILIHKYIANETAKSIALLYEKTEDKSILAIIEEYEIGEKQLSKLEAEIRDLQKNLVVLYVRRNSSTQEIEGKIRKLPSALEQSEIEVFENVFSILKPEKKNDILKIKKQEKRLITPFIYGFTAFGKDFKKLDIYVNQILDSIKDQKIKHFLGFIALIGRYTQNPIPEELFHNFLGMRVLSSNWMVGVPTNKTFLNNLQNEEKENIDKIIKIIKIKEKGIYISCLEVRDKLFAEEISEKLISGENPENRHLWRLNLKTWVVDLISIFKGAYPDEELYDTDKKLLDSLFIDKDNTSDEEGKKNFSMLIEEIKKEQDGWENARYILEELANSFNENADDAFYSQHLARLYYDSAKYENLSGDRRLYFYDQAINKAENAIQLYLKNPENNKSLSGLYHTKGHAAMLKLNFINYNFQSFQNVEGIEEIVKSLYTTSSDALNECLNLEQNSTYGYLSYSYLIVNILDFGRKKSNHKSLIAFFEDEEYEWYVDKMDLGIEIITNANNFWTKYNSNKKDDFQEIETKQPLHNGAGERESDFETKINQNLSKLYTFRPSISKNDVLSKSKEAKTKSLKFFWQNAYIDKVLGDKNFSNYNLGFTKLSFEELKEIAELLRINLQYKPNLRDIKRWLRTVRNELFNIDIQNAMHTLEFINKIVIENQRQNNVDLLLRIELAYYLYCLYSIQIIGAGESIGGKNIATLKEYNAFCKNYSEKLALRRTASFEWLGINKKDGFEQLVSRDNLGEIYASRHEFFQDYSLLKEVTGTITMIGNNSGGAERKAGEITLDGCNLIAFFIPIHGGYIENPDGSEQKCTFDNTKNMKSRVKFFIGFSYDGLRAFQPIPVDSVRANSNKKHNEIIHNNIDEILTNDLIKAKIVDVRKKEQYLMGTIEGKNGFIILPFAKGKNYDDYKYFKGQNVYVSNKEGAYEIIDNRYTLK